MTDGSKQITENPTASEIPTTAGMTTKVVKGSMWTLAGQIAPLAVSLFTTPFTIRLLGAEGYGVLILIGLIPTYLGFADFGMSLASTKFGSEAYAENNPEKEATIIRTAALIALISSVPIAAGLMIFARQIIELFNVPPNLQPEAVTALRIAAVTFVINFLCGIFNTPQLARLRMDLNTFINAGTRILGLIAAPIAIYLGFGIVGAVTVLLTASLLQLSGHLFVSRHLLPELIDTRIDTRLVQPMLNFGITIVFALVAMNLLTNLEKLILPKFSSVRIFAYYSVAFTLASMMTIFSNSISQSLIPAFSRLFASEKIVELNNLYSRAIRLNLIIFLPLTTFLLVIARTFFNIWAGPEFGENSTLPFYILSLGLLFNFSATVSGAVMIAAQKTKASAVLYWVEVIPYLILAGVLTFFWGAVGAAIAWSVRVIADAIGLFWLVRRLVGLKIEVKESRAEYLLIASAFLLVAPLLAIFLTPQSVAILISLAGGIIIYSVLVWRRGLTEDERRVVALKCRDLVFSR